MGGRKPRPKAARDPDSAVRRPEATPHVAVSPMSPLQASVTFVFKTGARAPASQGSSGPGDGEREPGMSETPRGGRTASTLTRAHSHASTPTRVHTHAHFHTHMHIHTHMCRPGGVGAWPRTGHPMAIWP